MVNEVNEVEVGPNEVPVVAAEPRDDASHLVEATAEQRTAIDTSVRTKIASYLAGKTEAHLAVIEAVMWAAKYGDAHYINVAYDLLGGFVEKPTADAQNLRVWCGVVSTYVGADEKEAKWLGFNSKASEGKKAGFFVKSGLLPKTARDAMNETVLKQGPRFMDRIAKSGNAMTIEKLLAEIARVASTITKKEEKVIESGEDKSLPIPNDLLSKLMVVSAEAEKELATRKAVKSGMN